MPARDRSNQWMQNGHQKSLSAAANGASDSREDLANRFGWWWRWVFEGGSPSTSIAEALAPVIAAMTQSWPGEVTFPVPVSPASQDKVRPLASLNRLYGILNAHRERSALLYELGKRLTGIYEFGKPWLALSEARKAALEKRWPATAERVICVQLLPGQSVPAGFAHLPPLCWNLKLNNASLVREFQRLLDAQRSVLGIAKPLPNQGRHNRALSWRPLELMDLAAAGILVLNGSQRSSISGARRLYRASI